MKRRKLLGYAGSGLATTVGMGWLNRQPAQAQQANYLTLRSLGHTAFLFTGGGQRLLSNPFRRLGCTAGFPSPAQPTDIVMLSSRLLDEGYLNELPGNPQVLAEPGVYDIGSLRIQGVRRLGTNTIWKWTQAGVSVVHMGGAAAPLRVEEQILLGRPDVLLVPVGGSPKAYTAEEAVQAIQVLRPKVVIPTHYLTTAANDTCNLSPLDDFLMLMQGTPITRAPEGTLSIRPSDLPNEGMRIQIYQYPRA
jgi:L-ascorbate metabolism protein UlaG (beta-lactamase superfamily)